MYVLLSALVGLVLELGEPLVSRFQQVQVYALGHAWVRVAEPRGDLGGRRALGGERRGAGVAEVMEVQPGEVNARGRGIEDAPAEIAGPKLAAVWRAED